MRTKRLGLLMMLLLGAHASCCNYFSGAELGKPCRENSECKGSLFGES